jgi:hypothetical protein
MKNKRMNKKGMFFTLMAMLLIGLFIFSITNPKRNITGIERLSPLNTRVKSLNDFVSSINNVYLDAIIRTTAYNVLKTAPVTFATLKSKLEEPTGTLSTSVWYWFRELNKSANSAYHSTVTFNSFELTEITQLENQPFSITALYKISYKVNEKNSNLYWEVGTLAVPVQRTTLISIIGLPDPTNSKIIAPPPDGTYYVTTAGDSYLEKIGFTNPNLDSNQLCPDPSC